MIRLFTALLIFLAMGFLAMAGELDDCRQLILSVAPDWNANTGLLQRFERAGAGEWRAAGEPWRVLYGKNGLAWGIGERGQEQPGLKKTERDKRAPAGLFRIGT